LTTSPNVLLFARRESPRKTVRRILQAVGVKERRRVSGETRSRESRKTAPYFFFLTTPPKKFILPRPKIQSQHNMKTIAQQLQIKKFPFTINDSDDNVIYCEYSDGYWFKYAYDSDGNDIYWENSDGLWNKREYDSNRNRIYWENSDGLWVKREYDSNRNLIYWEDSYGKILDNRPKTDVQKAIDLLTKEGLLVDGKILKQ
jgi:hypothetical protein